MLIIVTIFVFVFFIFIIELFTGIYTFNYNVKPLELIQLRHYAINAKFYYELYKKTGDVIYKQKVIKCLDELKKYMDMYDVRLLYGIDLIDIQKDIKGINKIIEKTL